MCRSDECRTELAQFFINDATSINKNLPLGGLLFAGACSPLLILCILSKHMSRSCAHSCCAAFCSEVM
jgi:hypothetical protein